MKRIILFLILLTYYQAAYAQSIFQGVESSGSDTGNYTSNITPYNFYTDTDRYTSNIAGTNQIYSSATTADYAEEFTIAATNTLNAGDIAFVGYHTDSDDGFTFIALTDIPAGEVIYFTDKGWNATNAVWYTNAEDHITWTAPAGGVSMGTVISIIETSGDSFTVTHGTAFLSGSGFSLLGGDSILAYQSSSGVEPTNPTFIAGIYGDDNYVHTVGCDDAGGWLSCSTCTHVSGSCSTTSGDTSGIPAGLTNGENAIALFPNTGEADNAKYTGTLTGTISVVRAAIHNPANWTTNQSPINIAANQYSGINITPDAPPNNAPTDISLSSTSIDQSATGVNATVGTLSTTDADGGDTHTYSLVSGTGDDDNASFNITGTTLRTAAYLAAGTYDIRVNTNDGTDNYAEPFTITVNDNVAPSITSLGLHNGNAFIEIFASEGLYSTNGASGALEISDIDISISGGTAHTPVVTSLKQLNGTSDLLGGEHMIRVNFTTTGVADGGETITINFADGNSVFDAAGNAAAATQTGNTRILNDLVDPYITGVSLAADNSYIDVTFNEGVYEDNCGGGGLTAADFDLKISGGSATFNTISSVKQNNSTVDASASALSGGETTIRIFFSVTGTPDGGETLEVDLQANEVFDINGRTAIADQTANNTAAMNDKAAPRISSIVRQSPTKSHTNADQVSWDVTFTEEVSNFGVDDLAVLGTTATVTSLTNPSGNTFRVTVSGGDLNDLDDTIALSYIASHDVTDVAGNALVNTIPTGTSDYTFVLDNTAPAITSFTRKNPTGSVTSASQLVFLATFSEDVTSVDLNDFTVTGLAGASIAVSQLTASTYDVTVSGGDISTYSGAVGLNLSNPSITDLAGNALPIAEPATDETYSLDNTAPTITSIAVPSNGSYETGEHLDFTLTFSELVNVDEGCVNPPALNITVGSNTRAAHYLSGTNSNSVKFRYTVQASDSDTDGVSINSFSVGDGVVYDAVGNSMVEDLPSNMPSTADVLVNICASATIANAGSDEEVCGASTTLAANLASGFNESGTWSVVAGAGGSFSDVNSPTATFTGIRGANYTLRWTISNGICTNSTDDVVITFDEAVTANAGSDQNVCGTSTFLGASYSTGNSGSWSILSGAGGSITSPSSPFSSFSGVVGTVYTLQWTETNGSCSDNDTVKITFFDNPTPANAGLDKDICGPTALSANAASGFGETGTWSVVAGAGGSFSDVNSPTATFTGTEGVNYTLRWTISNGVCPTSSDDVVITVEVNDVEANAGSDQNVCGTQTFLGAVYSTGSTGTWSILSGAGGSVTTPSSNTSKFTGTVGTTYTLQWTENSGSCSDTDIVEITFLGNVTVAAAGADQETCNTSVTMAANAASGFRETGTWSVVSGAGGSFADANSPTSSFTGTKGVSYTLRWTISNGVCQNRTDDVVITLSDDVTANAGSDQNVCGTNTFLGASFSTGSTGTWSILYGAGGTITTPTSNTSAFTGTAGTTYTLQWTENNGSCSDNDTVKITFLDNVTVAGAGADQEIDGALATMNATLAGNTASGFSETGTWSEVAGDGNGVFSDANSATSTFTGTVGVTYTLRWTISNGVCPISSDDVLIEFANNAGFTITETASSTEVDESGSTDTFDVVLDSEPASDVVINVSSGSTSEVTVDQSSLTFTSGNWNVPQTVTVQGVDDSKVDTDKSVKITLSIDDAASHDNYDAVIDQSVSVINENTTTASVTAVDVSVAEADGTATVTFTLDNAVEGGLSVDVSTVNGTATGGVDFSPITAQTITFSGTAGETETLDISITADAIVEADETITVSMSGLTPETAASADIDITDEATVTITNDDVAVITIADVTISEDAGTGTATLTLDKAVAATFDVYVNSAAGTAGHNDDFTEVFNEIASFAGTAGETQTINFTILDDDVVELDETFRLLLSSVTNTSLNNDDFNLTDEATVTITNDDAATLAIDDVAKAENADGTTATLTFTVTLTGDVNQGITVDFATSDGTALSASDYTSGSGTLNFAGTDGETQTLSVVVSDDDLVEADETFDVTLSNLLAGGRKVSISDATGVGTITNDDQASITMADVMVNEEDGTATVTLTLDNAIDGGLSVNVSTAGETATAGTDFTALVNEQVTFAGTEGETQTVTVSITDDAMVEADETITVSMSGLTPATAASADIDITDEATVTINNTDRATITIADASGAEADGAITLTATLDNAVDGGFFVELNTADVTALSTSDYTALTSEKLTFIGSAGEQQTFTITPTDDNIEESTETLTVSMSNISTGTVDENNIDFTDGATITITDEDDNTAPVGYSITLNDALIGSAETATTTFTFTGAEMGTTYNYTVSSDNGGTNATGSGTIATATDQVTLADLSELNDGTLTLSVTLTDASSNVGTAVTAQATIDQTMEATLSPADDAIDVLPDAKLSMDFGENVYKGTGNITIAQSSNDEVLETIAVSSTNVVVNGSEVTITPTNLLLPPSTEFYVSIEIGAITDDAGNSYSGATNKTAWTFTTIAAPVVTVTTVPTADTYAIGDELTFETSFTLPVTVTGTPSLPITIGTETKAATLSGTVSESNTATFTYTITEGDLDTDGITVGSAIDLNGATIVDEFGTDAILTLNNTASTANVNVDGVRATPNITSVVSDLTNAAFTVTVTYDEPVSGLTAEDLDITNGTADNVTVVTAGLVWTADITPTADGATTVAVAAAAVTDAAGNTSVASASEVATTFDGTAPTVSSIARAEADQLNTADTDANFTVTFSEDVTGVDVADFETVVTGSATASINLVTVVDAKTYTVNVNGISGQGTVGLSAKADASIIDAATNAFNTAASGEVYTINWIPTAIALNSSSIEENSAIGSLVGTFTTTDQDAGDSHIYTLVAGTGDTDNASFSINGDQLLTAEAFDFETKDSYSIRVKTDDGNGATFEQVLTITVDNVLEASITVTGEEMFEETILGFSTTKTWFVENNGEVPVEIRVSEAAAGFSVQPGSFVLGVGGSREISLVFTPEEARAYAGTITFDYEGGAPVTMNVSGSGVIVTDIDDQLMDEATINIYPNPASTVVTLDLTELYGLPVDVNIYSTTGQPMFNRVAVTDSKLRVDVSSYESGVYIVRFSNGNSVVNKKVMIKR